MKVTCFLCGEDVEIDIDEFLDLKEDDEYVCEECAQKAIKRIIERN